MMRPSAVLLMLVIGIASIGWISSANADIDLENPDWLMWRDTFGDPYDYYQEAVQGDSFTLHVVVNRTPPSWPSWQMRAYICAFWYDYNVVENWATPNYAYSSLDDMYNPAAAQIQTWNGYVQLTNDSSTVRSVYEGPSPEAPFVMLSWDFTIREDAALGEITIPLVFRTYNINGSVMTGDNVDDDPALTINVIPGDLPLPGDFEPDGDVDAADLQDLCDNMGGAVDPYDVDESGYVDGDDLIFLIENLVEWDNGVDTGVGTAQGDFNLDGVVNATDLAIMKGTFGTSGVNYADGNANCDELVNATDLAILKGTFGSVAPTGGGVPEPMTIGLLAMGGMAALLRRRKS